MFSTAYQHSQSVQQRIDRLRRGSESVDNDTGDNNNEEKNNVSEPSQIVPMEDNKSNAQIDLLHQENEKLKQQLTEKDTIIEEKDNKINDLNSQIINTNKYFKDRYN